MISTLLHSQRIPRTIWTELINKILGVTFDIFGFDTLVWHHISIVDTSSTFCASQGFGRLCTYFQALRPITGLSHAWRVKGWKRCSMSGNTCCYVPRETNCGASPGRTWEPGHRSNSSGLKIMKFVGFCGVTNLETAMPADEATESPAQNSSERRDLQTLVWFHHGPSEFSRLALLCPPNLLAALEGVPNGANFCQCWSLPRARQVHAFDQLFQLLWKAWSLSPTEGYQIEWPAASNPGNMTPPTDGEFSPIFSSLNHVKSSYVVAFLMRLKVSIFDASR